MSTIECTPEPALKEFHVRNFHQPMFDYQWIRVHLFNDDIKVALLINCLL
jgi:hypothetical protein